MKKVISIVFLAVFLLTAPAWAGVVGQAVEVSIVTDDGRPLPTYPAEVRYGVHKVYAEAVRGDCYRIEVRNRLDRRVGLVIAVDGRNIISGSKSWLKNTERMYILEPFGTGEFSGWRVARDRINRFYFTHVADSYAAAFGDESAMGVIAVAAYPEVERRLTPYHAQSDPPRGRCGEGKSAGSADRADARAAAPSAAGTLSRDKGQRSEQSLESAGTGYGHEEYAPSVIVAFEPEKKAVEKIYLKYEWRSTLCKLGIVACDGPRRHPPNRLWDDLGYAPPPPAKYRP
jgi:hypothetical protein